MPLKLYKQFFLHIAAISALLILSGIALDAFIPQWPLASKIIQFLGISVAATLLLHFRVGRYLQILTQANTLSRKHKIVHLEKEKLPSNEIANLYLSHERLLFELEDYQKNLGTKLKEAEHNLIRAAKLTAIGELTSTIVHDLRNPLTSIIGYAKILQEQASQNGGESEKDHLSRIVRAAHHIQKLVNRMSLFGRHAVQLEEGVRLSDCLGDTEIILERIFQQKSIKLTKIGFVEGQQCWGNKQLIVQILVNLLSNASDALQSSNEKEITISIEDHSEYYVLRVKDSGDGIPEQHLQDIFRPFFTTKEEGKGTGLGLASCRDICDILKSKIDARNDCATGGAIFSFCVWKKSQIAEVDNASPWPSAA